MPPPLRVVNRLGCGHRARVSAVGVDYKKEGFEFDVVQKGPMAGLAIRF